jgi:hypothetical protein
MSNEILFTLMQGGNTTTLFTQVGQIESKLCNITGTIAHMLETFDARWQHNNIVYTSWTN